MASLHVYREDGDDDAGDDDTEVRLPEMAEGERAFVSDVRTVQRFTATGPLHRGGAREAASRSSVSGGRRPMPRSSACCWTASMRCCTTGVSSHRSGDGR